MTIIDGKKDKIIVFDDPVASLDNNSITNICTTLATEAPKHRQVIIFTHYKFLIEKMYDIRPLATYIEIIKERGTSKIKSMDIGLFCRSPLEERYDEIDEFIKGDRTPDSLILRQFLEESLKTRFRKQLKEAGAHNESLSRIIKELKQQDCINNEVASNLESLKDSLNPDHHKVRAGNNEDIKNIAKSMFKLVYEEI